MARPEPMNASPSHPKLKLSLSFSDSIYVAGNPITGKLEMTASAEGSAGLGISLISVDLFAIQELTSRDHSATSTFLHVTRRFQGEGLPPSNAVHPYPLPNSPPLPEHYHGARRGTSSFLFKLPLPANSPSSISFGNKLANVKYMVRATVGVFWKGEKRLVVSTKELDVVGAFDWDSARNEPEGVTVGENGKIWMMGKVVGGVCVSGEPGCVELQVKNHSNKKNTSLQLTLTRHLILPTSEAPPIEISDTLATISFKGPEYIVPPGVEGVASLVFDVPRDARMVRAGALGSKDSKLGEVESIFEVRSVLEIKMGMGFGSKDLRLEIPVAILHPIALPDLAAPPVLPYANPSPYSGSNTPPYAPPSPNHPQFYPAQTPAPGPYSPYSPQSAMPYVDNNQVYFPPPSGYPMHPPGVPIHAHPPPSAFPPPSGYLPNARTGTPLPTVPQPPPPVPKEETLMAMPTAQPKSVIRPGAPDAIVIPPRQQTQPSPTTTPLHSPRPHQSVDYLTTEHSTASLGTRGMTRSKSVEELEKMAMEEDISGLDVVASPPVIERRHSDVLVPPMVTSQPQQQRRNSDLPSPRRNSRSEAPSVPDPEPEKPASVVPRLSQPLWKERKEQSRAQKRDRSPVPSTISTAAVMPVVMRNIGKNELEEEGTPKIAPTEPKAETMKHERTIKASASSSPTVKKPTNLLAAPILASDTQIGTRTKKLSRDFLTSLSGISPSSKGEEEKSMEELLKEQDISSPSGGLGGGLDALEQRLMMQVGTQQRPQGKDMRAIPTTMLKGTRRKQPSAVLEDEETEREMDWELEEPKTPRSAPIPILKPKTPTQSSSELEADSAVSSLTLGGDGILGSSPQASSSPLTRENKLPPPLPPRKAQDDRVSDESGDGHRHVSGNSDAPSGATSSSGHGHGHGHRGKKKMEASSNRVAAWFKGLDEEAPDPKVQVVGKSREREREKRERRKREEKKDVAEEKVAPPLEDNEAPQEEEKVRSSGFISFAAHAANTAKVTRSIIRSSPTAVFPPSSPVSPGGAREVSGPEAPLSRKVDVPNAGMTFQRIRAAFADSAEEERKLAGVGGLMGIWAGANPKAKVVEEPRERPIKYAWDAEAEALVAKNPWEEVLKARRDADTVQQAKNPQPDGPSYDIRSARGGRGGKVTAVREIWNTSGSAAPSAVTPPSPSTPTPTTTTKDNRRQSAPGPAKSLSVPALLSSSTADAVLSTTASLARPVPRNQHRITKSLGGSPGTTTTTSEPGGGLRNKLTSIAEVVGRQPPAPTKSTGDLAFGQARLKDLIKKYQGA
ncbi:hypothetical protein DL96DRAFT_1680026 [Flagelloscypha sp. PMI_526]|nr:hypothetical protein DL96DRAFT_1680026 [Flagelloscypha sp. PMI_526]